MLWLNMFLTLYQFQITFMLLVFDSANERYSILLPYDGPSDISYLDHYISYSDHPLGSLRIFSDASAGRHLKATPEAYYMSKWNERVGEAIFFRLCYVNL